jgi:hypothetical protein
LFIAALCAPALGGQVVRLTVQDSSSREPIGLAVVALVGAQGVIAATGITKRDGTLVVGPRAPGTYTIVVRRLGFTPSVSDRFVLGATDTVTREVNIHQIPQFLAPVAIRGERESILNAMFSGMKIGTLSAAIIAPSQVDLALPGATDYTDLVSRNPVPGLRVNYERKCVMSNRSGFEVCLPVIIDGLLTSSPNDVVPPEIVDYMLIVRGNELGVFYGTIGELGAVVIFTKRGPQRGPQEFGRRP